MTERMHLGKASTPITVESRGQLGFPGYKPRGLWYEVDGDWRRWCNDEMPHWIEGHFLHRVILGQERMLRLSSAAELDDFTLEFGQQLTPERPPFDASFNGIDWRRVAARWDGIEIAPYVWSRRRELMWYYGWDCASGCIWRPAGVTVESVSPEPLAVPA